jgi:hypothetical protein
MNYTTFSWLRLLLAVVLLIYAGWTVFYFATAAKGTLQGPLIVSQIVFWTLGPPLWFFAEYYMIDHNWVVEPAGTSKAQFLESVKAYADYASKIWAAVLGAVLFFATFNK